MPEVTSTSERLDQWKGIADYLGRDVSTVIRWAKEGGLPVHRVPGDGKRRSVFAYRHEIDRWMVSSRATGTSVRGIDSPSDDELSPASPLPVSTSNSVASNEAASTSKRRVRPPFLYWVAGAALAAGTLVAFQNPILGPQYEDSGETLILSDSAAMEGSMVAARGTLYFNVRRGGRIVILSAPETGGPSREIASPFTELRPQGFTPDGKKLLVLAGTGQEKEVQLWWLPVDGSKPTRIGTTTCHAAAVSRDGQKIAFVSGTSIFLTIDNGSTFHLLHTFSDLPRSVQWSLDGARLLAVVADNSEQAVLWKLSLDDRNPTTLRSITAVGHLMQGIPAVSPVLDDNDSVLFGGTGDQRGLYLVQELRRFRASEPAIRRFAKKITEVAAIALDRDTNSLFYGRGSVQRDELNEFDPESRSTHPFLPGISAHDVDFSRDGRWITYVGDPAIPRNTLWVAAADGKNATQLNTDGLDSIGLPRWSPDGKRIAFMGRHANEPYRIYVLSVEGGTPERASIGTDNQGAPTWSPDGHSLIYGRVLCEEHKSCGIFQIELSSGAVTMVPGSEGLTTARWSPDGRYIAALRSATHQVFLFDLRLREWKVLADGINGDDLAWSSDSQSVYASRPNGAKPAILRISPHGEVQEALDLSPWANLTGRLDTWFAVAPDGSLVFVRLVIGTEIVALHYRK